MVIFEPMVPGVLFGIFMAHSLMGMIGAVTSRLLEVVRMKNER